MTKQALSCVCVHFLSSSDFHTENASLGENNKGLYTTMLLTADVMPDILRRRRICFGNTSRLHGEVLQREGKIP